MVVVYLQQEFVVDKLLVENSHKILHTLSTRKLGC